MVKKMKLWKAIGKCLLTVLLLSAFGVLQITAAQFPDTEKTVSLTLVFQAGQKALTKAEFQVYQVGELSPEGSFSSTKAFADYPIVLEGLDSSGWRVLAENLVEYAEKNRVPELDEGQTDGNGHLRFPTGNGKLDPGLYLVHGKKHVQNGKIYTTVPFLTWLPSQNSTSDGWDYDVEAVLKYECRSISSGGSDDGGSEDGTTVNTGGFFEQPEPEVRIIEPFPLPLARLLPQTGTLWPMVPMLGIAGILLLLGGRIRNRKKDEEAP